MQAALQRLGYPCYHMTEVARAPGHLDAWNAFLSAQAPMDWQALFKQYSACVDTPACLYYEAILQAFPNAKVLLTLRDPDAWFDSLVSLSATLEEFRSTAVESPRLAHFLAVTDAVGVKLTQGDLSRENCIQAFNKHNRQVQDRIPDDRLLVFRVQQGWEPLCEFLQQDVPNEAFPHLNEGRSTIRDFIHQTLL